MLLTEMVCFHYDSHMTHVDHRRGKMQSFFSVSSSCVQLPLAELLPRSVQSKWNCPPTARGAMNPL